MKAFGPLTVEEVNELLAQAAKEVGSRFPGATVVILVGNRAGQIASVANASNAVAAAIAREWAQRAHPQTPSPN